MDCPHSGVGQVASSCGHTDDAGVRCRTCKWKHILKIILRLTELYFTLARLLGFTLGNIIEEGWCLTYARGPSFLHAIEVAVVRSGLQRF